MPEAVLDQAAGLRRLMGQREARVMTLVSAAPRTGQTTVAVNVALAAADHGARVVLVDEHDRSGNAADQLSVAAFVDLLDVVTGKNPLEEALVPASRGVLLLPAARVAAALPRLSEGERTRLAQALGRVLEPGTLLLVDAARESGNALARAARVRAELMLLASPGAAATVDAYRLMKWLATQCAVREFSLLATRIAAAEEAERLSEALARTARRYLEAAVRLAGVVPQDERLARAHEARVPLIDAFPNAPAAIRLKALAQALGGAFG